MENKISWIVVIVLFAAIICGTCVLLVELHNTVVEEAPAATSGSSAASEDTPPSGQFTEQDASYRTITDMAGRKVTIPANISLVLCTSPPPTTFVYMLAPEKLGNIESSAINQSGSNLTSISTRLTTTGEGSTNYEAYIAMSPDLVFILCESGLSDPGTADLVQEKLGTIPVVCVDNARDATMYSPTLLFMGDVLGVPDVAARQNAYYQSVLNEVRTKVAAIPEEERVRVYYAEGTDGLLTDAGGSCHSQLIDVCGGINVAGTDSVFSSSSAAVTKESVLVWKPDLIITTSKEFAAQVYDDTAWQLVPAVQNHRVYLTPSKPYNWFDRPPGVNRIVGIPWTAHLLYPDLFSEEWFQTKAKEFYQLFYHIDLSDEELTSLLAG